MKKIEDYLHLYLGCEVRTNDTYHDGSLIASGRVGKFIGFADERRVAVVLKFRSGPIGQAGIYFIKPILRPLSSMTEEEADYGLYEHWIGVKKHGQSWSSALFNPQQFHYLLSEGFDLFGLIEAGLATTLTDKH